MLQGITADCLTADENKETVTIRSSAALEVKAVTVGVACLQSYRINNADIRFAPFFINSHSAEFSQSIGGTEPSNLTIELDQGWSSSGIVTLYEEPALSQRVGLEFYCSITAPAMKLDLKNGGDIWLYHFRSSPSRPYDYQLDKATLTVTHGSSSVMVSIAGEPNGDLKLETAFTDTGYGRASLVLRRDLGNTFIDQTLGDIRNETANSSGANLNTTIWRPVFRSFDFILICDSKMKAEQFIQKEVALFGARPVDPTKTNPLQVLGLGGHGNFVLSDGADIKYTLMITGYRRFLSDDDEVGMSLSIGRLPRQEEM
jgi:hypothetical protein